MFDQQAEPESPSKQTLDLDLYIEAGSASTPDERLTELSLHQDPRIRRRVAENSASSLRLLLFQAGDPNADVRTAVAENKKLPADYLHMFLDDTSADVRYSIAENHSMPERLLLALTRDDSPYVAHRAEITLKELRSDLQKSKLNQPLAPLVSKPNQRTLLRAHM